MLKKPLFFSILILLSIGTVANANDGNSGKGWIEDIPFSQSGHQALVRKLMELDDWDRTNVRSDADFERLEIALHDLNDDGVAEVIIYFGVTAYCGTVGCEMGIYQNIDGSWQRIGLGKGHVVWVSDQKVLGYRTMYSQGPDMWRWDGKEYRGLCSELPLPDDPLPPEVQVYVGKKCESDERG